MYRHFGLRHNKPFHVRVYSGGQLRKALHLEVFQTVNLHGRRPSETWCALVHGQLSWPIPAPLLPQLHGEGVNAPISSSCSLSPAASCSSCAILACICFCCSVGSAAFFPLPFFAGAGAMEADVDVDALRLVSMLRGFDREWVEVGWCWWATVAMNSSNRPLARRALQC
jgi:hypothetical protein